ncbi:ER membrane protein complex subunit 1 [Gracilariopsis chorda]|uniref:ER membrane protein complex subunit 1 n=1 Tax=Gracilariopsis chorda TaxID=448386 RepID=A0A2V3IXB8_9FLOR|nr:ER membrane protein complex subunit 1 [Gracilariopsis chorda]|eukprot:PXF46337.1 ER membrane protein complex subunit 1 [Gracilariopsis chorda]
MVYYGISFVHNIIGISDLLPIGVGKAKRAHSMKSTELLTPFFFFLSYVISVSVCASWSRTGIGRVVWVSSLDHGIDSNVFVLTAKSTLASLHVSNGSIVWRSPYPISDDEPHPIAVTSAGSALVISFSDNRIRACLKNGSVQWEIRSCELLRATNEFIVVRSCESGEEAYTRLSNGEYFHPADKNSASSVAVDRIQLNQENERVWDFNGLALVSHPDGRFEAHKESEILWSRDEGFAHPTDVALYSHSDFSVLVFLSELGFMAGLDATKPENVIWRETVQTNCRLVQGHAEIAVVTCITGKDTTVLAVRSWSGEEVLRKSVSNFKVWRAEVENECHTSICVQLSDYLGASHIVSNINNTQETVDDAIQLRYEVGGTKISAIDKKSVLWQINAVPSSRIVLVVYENRHPSEHSLFPPAVRVTGDRRVLFKDTNPNLILILSYDERKKKMYAMLVDGSSGVTHQLVEHPNSGPAAIGVKGDGWFVYTTWNIGLMAYESNIVDLYRQPEIHASWVQERLRQNIIEYLTIFKGLSPWNEEKLYMSNSCSFISKCEVDEKPVGDGRPHVVRSSAILTQTVVAMTTTSTKLGITERSPLFVLDSGQITLVPKKLLDARRPRDTNPAYGAEYLKTYNPLLSLRPTSYDNTFLENGIPVAGIRSISCAPHPSRESPSQVVIAGLDLLYTHVHPIGKFDSLSSDFNHSTIVLMIAGLLISYMYSEGLLRKLSLSRSW